MAAYREGARRREAEARAWELARQAVDALRQRFGVERVVVSGSIVHPGCFTPWSDVDITAWGLHPDDTFRAIGVAMDLDPEIPLNLVDVGCCRPAILEAIEHEGVPIRPIPLRRWLAHAPLLEGLAKQG